MLIGKRQLIFLIVFFLSQALIIPAFGEDIFPFQAEVTGDNINLRSDATVSAAPICTLNKNDILEVASQSFEWYKVHLPKNAPSYVKLNLLECIKFEETNTANNPALPGLKKRCLSAKAKGERINVRLKPEEGSNIIGRLDNNEVVKIISEDNGWFKIEPVSRSFGWVHKNFLAKMPEPALKEEVKPQEKQTASSVTAGKEVILTGVIEPYGKVFRRKATHKLITDIHSTYLLKGNKEAMDALNHHKVKVTGKIMPRLKEKYPVILVSNLEVIN